MSTTPPEPPANPPQAAELEPSRTAPRAAGRCSAIRAALAWVGILAIATVLAWSPAPDDVGEFEDLGSQIGLIDEMGGRVTLALCRMVAPEGRASVIEMSGLGADSAGSFGGETAGGAEGSGSPDRRIAIDLAKAILAGEAIGAAAGLEQLPSRKTAQEMVGSQFDWPRTWDLVEAGLQARDANEGSAALSDSDLAVLRESLGWFGDVVVMWHEGPVARKTWDLQLTVLLRVLLAALVWFAGFGLVGLVLLPTLILALALGWISPKVLPLGRSELGGGVAPGAAWWIAVLAGAGALMAGGWLLAGPPGLSLGMALAVVAGLACWPGASTRRESLEPKGGGRFGVIYAETFLIWILLFVGLQVAAESLLGGRTIIESAMFMVASLSALAWPRFRGVAYSTMCDDIGLRWGPSWWRPPIAGLATYSIGLPLVIVGIVLSAALTALFGPGAPASHPIQDELASANMEGVLALLVLAAVVVPPIEEIMFRGVLYRHLRETFGRMGSLLGFAGAALVSSLLFAAIHPQGLGFVPILAALAVAFCIARELTGSVVPGVIAHGLSNAAVVALNAGLFSA